MIALPSEEDFARLRAAFAERKQKDAGIGTLGEKALHNMLKYLFCPDGSCHEQKIGPYVADAVADGALFEIQTGNFYPLKKKIEYYLANTDLRVVIVAPAAEKRQVIWVDPETGETGKPHAYTASHERYKLARELFPLCDVWESGRVSVVSVRLEIEEYRMLDGFGKDKKRRSTKGERVPVALLGYRIYENKEDFWQLVPKDLPDVFDAAAFSRLSRLSRLSLSAALGALQRFGVISLVGKEKRKNLYRVNKP